MSRRLDRRVILKKKIMPKVFVLLLSLTFVSACSSETGQNAAASQAKKSLPEPTSVGAMLLHLYCANCHGVPQPDIHKKNEWRNVVYRMNMRRIKRALGEIPESDFDTLVLYLEKHAQ